MCTKYCMVNHLFKLAKGKSVVMLTDSPPMTIDADLGRKATKQTNKVICDSCNVLIFVKLIKMEFKHESSLKLGKG